MKEAGSGKPNGVSLDDSLSVELFQVYQILASFWGIYFLVDAGPKLSQGRRKRVELGSANVEDKGVSVDLHSCGQQQPGLSHLSPCAVKDFHQLPFSSYPWEIPGSNICNQVSFRI